MGTTNSKVVVLVADPDDPTRGEFRFLDDPAEAERLVATLLDNSCHRDRIRIVAGTEIVPQVSRRSVVSLPLSDIGDATPAPEPRLRTEPAPERTLPPKTAPAPEPAKKPAKQRILSETAPKNGSKPEKRSKAGGVRTSWKVKKSSADPASASETKDSGYAKLSKARTSESRLSELSPIEDLPPLPEKLNGS